MRRLAVRRGLARPLLLVVAGVTTMVVALAPPAHRAAEELFSGHMVQHLLLVTVAAPLLAGGLPGLALVVLGPRLARHRIGRRLHRARRRLARARIGAAVAAWVVHVIVLWAWHAPALYEAALRAPALHALEHATLLGTGLAFWAVVVNRRGAGPLGATGAVLYLFAAAGQSTALGALLTLTTTPSYPIHADTVGAWGLTLLADQQLAGVIMWVLGGMGYLAGALAILARVTREPASHPQRRAA